MAEKKSQEELVKETMERIEKEKKANKEAEARGAAPDLSKSKPKEEEPKGKTKDEQDAEAKAQKEKEAKEIREKAEAQVREDRRILETQDNKLTDKDKVRKAELKKRGAQKKIGDRIGELHSEIQTIKKSKEADNEANKKKIADLEAEVTTLKGPSKPNEKEELKKAEEGRRAKLIEEDKDKPREDRREMSQEEFDAWQTEDFDAAQDWRTDRTIRRHEARKAWQYWKNLSKKQEESHKRVSEKNPKMNLHKAKERAKELQDQGKSKEEIGEILAKDYPEAFIAGIVYSEHPEWKNNSNAPELVAAEVEKRMKAKSSEKPKGKTEEEKVKEAEDEKRTFDEAVDAEIERRKNADEAAGIESTRAGAGEGEEKSDLVKEQEKLGKKVGMSAETLKKARDRRTKLQSV